MLCGTCLSEINDRLASYWTSSATGDTDPAAQAGTVPGDNEAITA
ncbi:hypothetical protein NQK81_02325 [Amycolatopsis roodepoortensis]|nr:hypothetical protein [Amycolatopsis roodepoortensis]UUV32310.1 hypothetical protein NQK81_02325 [Amycolatopsis roodepoortensis]